MTWNNVVSDQRATTNGTNVNYLTVFAVDVKKPDLFLETFGKVGEIES